jgi:F-type H+-transporting ATPase subunit gamma
MSKRREVDSHLRSLGEIREIMNAMKNLSVMELHRLERFLVTQRRVVASIAAAAADFRGFYPELFYAPQEFHEIYLLMGSERGFCGDFNDALSHAAAEHLRSARDITLVVLGGKLVARLADDYRISASLTGPSVVEEVDPTLVKLMEILAGLSTASRGAGPLRLTVYHHDATGVGVKVSILQPFENLEAKIGHFSDAPRLYLPPEDFFAKLAEHYLFAALHELLYSSLMAENQRRMQHTDAAVRQLERGSAELMRKRNVLRQEEITEEIEVIMLSVEAVK